MCKTHWKENIKQFNLDVVVDSRSNLFGFLVNIHNKVNRMTGKQQMDINEAKEIYKLRNPKNKWRGKMMICNPKK
jgi:hypothetical protein